MKYLSFILLIIFSISFVNADTNGVWHKTSDIRSGIFGSDEDGNSSWQFTGPVKINPLANPQTYALSIINGNLGVGTENPRNQIQVIGSINSTDIYSTNNIYSNNNILATKRVGIGSDSPRTRLEVNGRVFITSDDLRPDSGNGLFLSYSPNNSIGVIQAYNFNSNSGRNLIIQAESNTAFGNIIPTEKVHVQGNVKANNIIATEMYYINGESLDSRYVNENQANSITSAMIVDGQVANADIANNAINSAKIQDGSVGSADINSNQVQKRVSGTCPAGESIRSINSDGSVVCEAGNTGKWEENSDNQIYSFQQIVIGGDTALIDDDTGRDNKILSVYGKTMLNGDLKVLGNVYFGGNENSKLQFRTSGEGGVWPTIISHKEPGYENPMLIISPREREINEDNDKNFYINAYNSKTGIGVVPSTEAKLEINGMIKIGNRWVSCDSSLAGAIRWTGENFEGCDGLSWIELENKNVLNENSCYWTSYTVQKTGSRTCNTNEYMKSIDFDEECRTTGGGGGGEETTCSYKFRIQCCQA
jgi:hypothetical protein